ALVACNLATAVFQHVLGREPGAALGHDDGMHPLAPALVGHADHRDFGHALHQRDRILDLGRIDVLAARDDHVLEAIDDIDEAFLVHGGPVARVVPAVLEHGGALRRLFPVTP